MKSLLDLFRRPVQDDEEKQVRQDFRAVFDTEQGRRVLGYLLADMHFFDEIVDSEEERVLQNYARKLLANCGAWRGQNVPAIVGALMGLPWQDEPTRERSKGE